MSSPTTRATSTPATSATTECGGLGRAGRRPGATVRIATVVGMRGQARAITAVGIGGVVLALLTGCAPWLRQSAVRHRLGPQPRRRSADQQCPRRSAGDRSSQERPGVERLHRQGLPGRRNPAHAGRAVGVCRYDADLDPIAGATGTVTIGVMRPSRSRPRRCRTPGVHHRFGPALVAATADMGCRVRAPTCWPPIPRRRGPPRDRNVQPDRMPRRIRPPADARTSAVPVRRRPGGQPGHNRPDRHDRVHRCHRPGDSAYDSARAAEDLERLRSNWDVPALALIGVGNGARWLAYAGSHPDKVARLVLDSPSRRESPPRRPPRIRSGPAGGTGCLRQSSASRSTARSVRTPKAAVDAC